jgi:hypothetical protein
MGHARYCVPAEPYLFLFVFRSCLINLRNVVFFVIVIYRFGRCGRRVFQEVS